MAIQGMDIGIDLGTTTIIIYMHGKGIVLKEPSVVAINKKTDSVLAVGEEAYRMIGRTPEYINAERPLKDGVISNHIMTEMMIKEFLRKVCGSLMIKPRVAICIPSAITEVEKRAVTSAAVSAGARRVYLIQEPIAAALGSGVDISLPNGQMMVDIGGGTADIAVISLSGVVVSQSVKMAGNHFDQAIVKYILNQYKILIGEKMAEKIKIDIGCVFDPSDDLTTVIKGRNVIKGLPEKIEINQQELYPVLLECAMEIVSKVKAVLDLTPPELAGDIKTNGIILTGGGCLIRGLDRLLAQEIGVPARIADDPVECVAIGTGKAFDYIEELQDGFENALTYKH